MRLQRIAAGVAATVFVLAMGACSSSANDDSSDPTDAGSVADLIGAPVELITPPRGGGARPVLEWTAVDGADSYRVAVFTTDGVPYWAWTGATTSVRLGAVSDEVSDGPRLSGQQEWQVVAFAGSTPVAHSGRQPIAP